MNDPGIEGKPAGSVAHDKCILVFPSSIFLSPSCVYVRRVECLLFVLLSYKSNCLLGSLPCSVNHFSSGAEASDNLLSQDLIRYIPVGMDTCSHACSYTHRLRVYLTNYQPLKASYEKYDFLKITNF